MMEEPGCHHPTHSPVSPPVAPPRRLVAGERTTAAAVARRSGAISLCVPRGEGVEERGCAAVKCGTGSGEDELRTSVRCSNRPGT